jgi:hypothetical protein
MVLYKVYNFSVDDEFKMATTTRHRITGSFENIYRKSFTETTNLNESKLFMNDMAFNIFQVYQYFTVSGD